MDINTLKRSACLFIAVMSLSSQAFAADNEVTFTGSILDSTCTVNVNGGQSIIDLGGEPKSSFTQQGDVGAAKIFNIVLESCPADGSTKAYIKFSGQTDTNSYWFKNTATDSPASNIAVMVKQGETVVAADDGNDAVDLPTTGGDVTVNYSAQFVATATGVTSGAVSSTLTYNVSYQ